VSDEVRTADYEGNTRGWAHELGHLEEYIAKVAA
jgi:hypothetical protein